MLKFDTRTVPPSDTFVIAATSILIITLRGCCADRSAGVQSWPQPGLLKITYVDGQVSMAGGCQLTSGNASAFGSGRPFQPSIGRTLTWTVVVSSPVFVTARSKSPGIAGSTRRLG